MYTTPASASLPVAKKLDLIEKVLGTPYESTNPQTIDAAAKTAKNVIIGAYSYQPNPTIVPTAMLTEFADANMAEFKTQLEVNAKIKLRYAKFSLNTTPVDPYGNYYQVTDYMVAIVFDTTTTDYSPTEILNLALNTPWFNDMWYACNMQNATPQAWLLATAPPAGDNTWLIAGAVAAVAIIGGLVFVMRRKS